MRVCMCVCVMSSVTTMHSINFIIDSSKTISLTPSVTLLSITCHSSPRVPTVIINSCWIIIGLQPRGEVLVLMNNSLAH